MRSQITSPFVYLCALFFGQSLLHAQVAVEVEIFETQTPDDDYLTWSPIKARIRLQAPQAIDIAIVLTNDAATDRPDGGDLVFSSIAPVADNWPSAEELPLTLIKDRTWSPFFIAGKFGAGQIGKASTEDKDAVLDVHQGTASGTKIGSHAVMVRVRKNALSLTDGERTRYLKAIRDLRQNGQYAVFQQIHAANPLAANPDAHGGPAFIPWHRVYLLAYERSLQAIDPSVSLPYWRFDEPAPAVFSDDFMGANSVSPSLNPQNEPPVPVEFATSNHLFGWTTDLLPLSPIPAAGTQPLRRAPADRSLVPSRSGSLIRNQMSTIQPLSYSTFLTLEPNPHGFAHIWAGGNNGSLGRIPTAVQDPLFFMLHCNVDRLWAAWQRKLPPNAAANGRRYEDKLSGYFPQIPRKFPGTGTIHIGHYADDTMWPWNGITGMGGASPGQRPSTAPGGAFTPLSHFAPSVTAPNPTSVLDYQGRIKFLSNQGVGYDDDPFKAE